MAEVLLGILTVTRDQKFPIKLLATSTLLAAMVSLGAPGPSTPGIGINDAQAASKIRHARNPCHWYALGWDELNAAEQRAWAKIGWNAELWNSTDRYPPADDKIWGELSPMQRSVLTSLSFNSNTWDNIQCVSTK